MGGSQAESERLAFINDAGHAIMKVDNSTRVKPKQNRDSIRISTKDQFTVGTVWVADILHVPFGVRSFGPAQSSRAIAPVPDTRVPASSPCN